MHTVLVNKQLSLLLCLGIFLGWSFVLTGQMTISPADFLQTVWQNHPASRAANLLRAEARATEQVARGGFDPKAYLDYDDKLFKGTDYWDIGEGGIKIPTMGGLELSGGYRWASGSFLNPENFQSPVLGQAFAGVKLNLLQGLITDDRRTALQRADLLNTWNEIEILDVRNELAYEAMLAYLNWSLLLWQSDIIEEGIVLAETRLEQTRQGFEAGDMPALDTLETKLQLRQRRADLLFLGRDLEAARRMINQFNWSPNGQTVELAPTVAPLIPTDVVNNFQSYPVTGVGNNPALRVYQFKLRDLQLEGRLKRQKLLPKVSFKYELLAEGFDFTPQNHDEFGVGDFLLQDNKWTLAFSAPLLFRKERGEVALNNIKQERTQLQQQQKGGELQLKLDQYNEQVAILSNQRDVYQQIVADYAQLLAAEQIKFNLGESSVFLLNSRESKLLDSRLKLAKAESDLAKVLLGRAYTTGDLLNW